MDNTIFILSKMTAERDFIIRLIKAMAYKNGLDDLCNLPLLADYMRDEEIVLLAIECGLNRCNAITGPINKSFALKILKLNPFLLKHIVTLHPEFKDDDEVVHTAVLFINEKSRDTIDGLNSNWYLQYVSERLQNKYKRV